MTFTMASTYLAILLLCIVTLIAANEHITLEESNNNVEESNNIFEDLVGNDEEVGGSAEELVPIDVSTTRIKAT